MQGFSKQRRREFGAAAQQPEEAPSSSGRGRDASPMGRAVAAFYADLVGIAPSGATAPAEQQELPAAAAGPAAPEPAAAAPEGPGPCEPPPGGGPPEPAAEPASGGDRIEILAPLQHRMTPRAAGPPAAAAAGPAAYGISRGNLGFQMLVKSGWKEGTGLGAGEQGRHEPLLPQRLAPSAGLGYAHPQKPQLHPTVAAAKAAAAAAAAEQQQQQGGQAGARAGAARPPLPTDPLEAQSTEAKVKRVRQVMKAEADEAAGRAIQRYIYRAFSDAAPGEPTADANPLLRRRGGNARASATNPLL